MATSPKPSFNHNMIAVFKRALAARNADQVEHALECGVDPSTPLEEGVPAIAHLLHVSFDHNEHVPQGMTREEYDNNTARILDAMFDCGLKVAEPQKYETDDFEYLVDHFMFCDRPGEVSTMVLHAIYESIDNDMGAYEPSITTHLQHLIDSYQLTPAHDIKGFISSHLNMMESIHNTVRARLANPQSDIEKQLVNEMGDQLGYWKGPFPRPSIASLLGSLKFEGKAPVKEREILTVKKGDGTANNTKPPAQKPQASNDDEDKFIAMMKPFVKILPQKVPAQVVAEIEAEFIGLDSVKAGIRRMFFRQQFDIARDASGLSVEEKRYSTVMKGNPGLGKTTFARKKAEFLHAIGETGNRYAELSRENLVGAFIGHTEAKITALLGMVDVVFIDEAYNLVEAGSSGNDFGKKVIDALLTAIENNPNLVVFMAGYPKEMEDLIASNPGLRSRLGIYEDFEDMNREQLGKTLDLMLGKGQMTIEADARSYILDQLDACRKSLGERDFGNARLVRNIVQKLPDVMAERLFGGGEVATPKGIFNLDAIKNELSCITLADAKAIDYKQAFGTHSAKAAAAKSNSSAYAGTRIGFTADI